MLEQALRRVASLGRLQERSCDREELRGALLSWLAGGGGGEAAEKLAALLGAEGAERQALLEARPSGGGGGGRFFGRSSSSAAPRSPRAAGSGDSLADAWATFLENAAEDGGGAALDPSRLVEAVARGEAPPMPPAAVSYAPPTVSAKPPPPLETLLSTGGLH